MTSNEQPQLNAAMFSPSATENIFESGSNTSNLVPIDPECYTSLDSVFHVLCWPTITASFSS